MPPAFVQLPPDVYDSVLKHLLRRRSKYEEAAFIFADARRDNGSVIFEYRELMMIAPQGFAVRSEFYLELRDETRQQVIKRAHDLGMSIVEFHSHPVSRQAEFSYSDRSGLKEFVPHLLWRLKGRPYGAVVVTPRDFDGLAWVAPESLELLGIRVGTHEFTPTGLSLQTWEDENDVRPL